MNNSEEYNVVIMRRSSSRSKSHILACFAFLRVALANEIRQSFKFSPARLSGAGLNFGQATHFSCFYQHAGSKLVKALRLAFAFIHT